MDKTQFETEAEQVRSYRDDNNMSFAKIAELMGFSERTAQRRYAYRGGRIGKEVEVVTGDLEDFPDSALGDITPSTWLEQQKGPIERFNPLHVEGDAIVTSDWHIPLHDVDMVNELIHWAKKTGIRKLIIAGDYWNMDSLSSYLPHQPEADLQTERYDGNLIMKTLLQYFDEIYITWGNHDFRLSKKLGFKKSFYECMKWMFEGLTDEEWAKITITDLDYLYYQPESDGPRADQRWYVCHPRNFSSVPLTVGRKLAVKHNCNVYTGHSHHFAIGVAADGRNVVIEGGGLYDPRRTEYIQQTTTHHSWVQGFTIFQAGIPFLISPVFNNTEVK